MLLEHKNDTLTFTEKMSAVKAAIFLSDMDMLNWNQECLLFVCFKAELPIASTMGF